MWNPFKAKNGKHEEEIKESKEPTPLVKRLQEPDTTDLHAQEVLEKSADACMQSTIMDADALIQLRKAKARTDTIRRKVKKNQSTILQSEGDETVQERALRELAELEERERAEA